MSDGRAERRRQARAMSFDQINKAVALAVAKGPPADPRTVWMAEETRLRLLEYWEAMKREEPKP